MKKRIISLLLIAVMLISMVPLGVITVFADDTSFVGGVKDYMVCNGEQGQESYTWLSLQQAVQNSGTVTLANDVICDNQTYGPIVVPEEADVTIDLNGYKIDRNLTTPVDNGAVIEVFGSLTVKDSSSAKTGIITGGYNTGSDGIMVAGGIQVDGGTLVLESGSITGCSSERHGAGVNIKNGIFIMNGGIISGNRANSHGAGVCVTYGIFTMTDGIISENRSNVGAGVYATNSDLLLSGGEISRNNANESGGGLNASGSANVTLTGCKITGNTASKAGGVSFYLADYGNFSFNVGKNTMIIGNTDTNRNPSNLYLNNFNQKTILTIMDGENAPNGMSIGISMQKTPSDSNPIPVSDASASIENLSCFTSDSSNYDLVYMNGIYLATKDMCGVTFISGAHGDNPEPTLIKKGSLLTPPTQPKEYGYSFLGWYKDASLQNAWDFDKDTVDKNIILYGKWEDSTWLSLQQAVQNSGTVTLSNDVICDNQTYGPIVVPEGVDVTIDLNGYKIDRNLTTPVDNGAVIEVFGSLTVKDSSSAKTGIITGGYNTGSDGIMVAGGIQVDGGTLVLESGSITGCSSERHGAGVNIKNGIFIMNGGIISGNRANSHGAGVCVTYGIFTMTDGIISENRSNVGAGVYATNSDLLLSGGEISRNNANETGGGLNASGSANVTLTGCKITGNTASKAGGVSFYLADYGNFSFNVGKNTMIIGNTDTNRNPSNLYLNNFNQKTMLTIMDGENAPNDMSIGISMQKTPSDSNPIPVSDATMKNAYLACFFSDNNNYSLSIMDDILYMTNEHTYIYGDVDHDGEITIIDVTIIQRYLAFFDDKLTDEDLLCCDADGNGKISILDCTHIQRYISKLSCSDNVGKHFTI